MPLIDLNGLGYFKDKENAMIADNYSSSGTYAVGDYVYHSGTLYKCTTAITSAEAWTAAHWTAAKLAEDVTSQSEKIDDLKNAFDISVGTVLHNLPSGYTEKQYIENTSNALIDTGITWTKHPRVEIDVFSTGGIFFGNYHSSSKRIYGSFGGAWFYGSSVISADNSPSAYLNKRVTIDYYDTYLKVNGITVGTFDATGASGSANSIALFARKYTGSGGSFSYANNGTRIYRAKLSTYANSTWTTVFDGIPCVRDSDDSAGFYDLVSNSFKAPTTGTVIAGEFANLYDVDNRLTETEKEIKALEPLDYSSISSNGTSGVFTSDFTVDVPFNGTYDNQIYSCLAKYEQGSGVTDVPTIQFLTGENLNRTSTFVVGENGKFVLKEWRVVRYPSDKTTYTVKFVIPEGVTLTIKDFYSRYDNSVDRVPHGIAINGHRRLPMTPYDTIHGIIMGAKAGLTSFIEIPKRLSDGTWIFYHDDTLVYNDTYIRQSDGTELPSTYNGTAWSSIDYDTASSWDWGVLTNARFAGTKPMTMQEFFSVCAKTGIHPSLSIHPFPTSEQLGEIKALALKYGVLKDLTVKATQGNMSTLYSVFGNDIKEYVLDVLSGSQTATVINSAISTMDGLTDCIAQRTIELFASTAYNAYFGDSPYNAFELISAAGYGCSIAQQAGSYSPNGDSTTQMSGRDIMWWCENHGVTEFTVEYNYSTGLNW